jgi:hypothetical protein
MKNVYKILTSKYERDRPIGRPRPRWENIIKVLGGKLCTGFIWLGIGSNGGFL